MPPCCAPAAPLATGRGFAAGALTSAARLAPMNRFALLVTVRVHPGRAEAFLQKIREAAATAVREEEHCLRFDVAQDESDPNLFVLFEVYTDAAALAHHHATAHFITFQAQAGPWIAEKTRRRLSLWSS